MQLLVLILSPTLKSSPMSATFDLWSMADPLHAEISTAVIQLLDTSQTNYIWLKPAETTELYFHKHHTNSLLLCNVLDVKTLLSALFRLTCSAGLGKIIANSLDVSTQL